MHIRNILQSFIANEKPQYLFALINQIKTKPKIHLRWTNPCKEDKSKSKWFYCVIYKAKKAMFETHDL